MSEKVIVKDLYIFSISDETARHFNFTKDINIITSNQKDGNKRGKSVILTSIYHTLGADGIFDKKWDLNSKTFIMYVKIKQRNYYIFRNGRLFKIFDESKKLLFITVHRNKLAEYLYHLYDFEVYLSKKNEDELVIAPPAYAYLLNFLDQDKMDGSKFSSFDGLQQFSNYKTDLLYTHFGVFNREYYQLINEINILKNRISEKKTELNMLEQFISKVDTSIEGVDSIPITNIEALEMEIKRKELEYQTIYLKLNKCKKKLLDFRNTKFELKEAIKDIKHHSDFAKKDLKEIQEKHICPYCKSKLNDDLNFRIHKHNEVGDYIILNSTIQFELTQIEELIEKEKYQYEQLTTKLHLYEQQISNQKTDIKDVLKVRGYSEMKETLLNDLTSCSASLKEINQSLNNKNKIKKAYDDKKSEINDLYYMILDKNTFGLEEITEKDISNISANLSAKGSNKPIITLIWHFNLLKIKYKFNPNAIKFPIVLDSPSNGELDDTNQEQLFKYLFDNILDDTQCIISTLGFDENSYIESGKNFNIIRLENEKYKLLNKEEFEIHFNLFDELNNLCEISELQE